MLEHVGWTNAIIIEENVYPNLVKVFYSNMDISASKNDRVITNVFNVPTEFDMGDLNMIIGIEDEDLDIYASRKELKFSKFMHVEGVRNICRHKDFSTFASPILVLTSQSSSKYTYSMWLVLERDMLIK